MPIYEYRCQSCDSVMEALVRGGKEPTACKECGAEALTRLISQAGIIFKGSGFYVTDSKSSGSGGGNGSSSNGSSKGSSESGTSESTSSGGSKESAGSTSSSSSSEAG